MGSDITAGGTQGSSFKKDSANPTVASDDFSDKSQRDLSEGFRHGSINESGTFQDFLALVEFPYIDGPGNKATSYFYYPGEKQDLISGLEKLFQQSDFAASVFREIVHYGEPLHFLRGKDGSEYTGAFNRIEVDPDDETNYFMMLDGKIGKLSLETIVFHEIFHFLEDLRTPGGFAYPEVEQIDSIPFSEPSFDYFGNALRAANIVRSQLENPEPLRGSYKSSVSGAVKDDLQSVLDELGSRGFRAWTFDQAIHFVDPNFQNLGAKFSSDGTRLNGRDSFDFIYGNHSNNYIHTGAGDDLIVGNVNTDKIYAGKDNDFIIGQEGNDEIDGGPGYDRAVYSGQEAEYKLEFDTQGKLIVEHTGAAGDPSGDGKDTLTGIEEIWFSDAVLKVAEIQ